MAWSPSEFLGLLEVRGACWGQIRMGDATGIRVRPQGNILFYALLEGRAVLSAMGSAPLELSAGDIAIVLSNGPHALRSSATANAVKVEFLDNYEYGDRLHYLELGDELPSNVLCGRLKVRWPVGLDPPQMPGVVHIPAQDNIVNLALLMKKATGQGASAMMTRAAGLLLVEGLRDLLEFQSIFRQSNFREPISRAVRLLELHPHIPWTVSMIATKVGMARSTFANRFHEEVGKTPIEVLTDVRMRKAAELLENSELKLADVAESLCYRSQSAFSHRFEHYFQITPGKMRALARQRRKQKDSATAADTGQPDQKP
jgi:AraC family transcriptional activator of mtrCDE